MAHPFAEVVLPLARYAAPEAVLVFNASLAFGLMLLGGSRRSRQEPLAPTAWCTGAAVAVVLVMLEHAASRLAGIEVRGAFLDQRYFLVGGISVPLLGAAARRVLLTRPWELAVSFVCLSLVLTALVTNAAPQVDGMAPLIASGVALLIAVTLRASGIARQAAVSGAAR